MIEVSFRHELYDAEAIDEAVKTYGAYGTVEAERGEDAWRVRVSAGDSGVDDRTFAAELANYALGVTIERARAGEEAQK